MLDTVGNISRIEFEDFLVQRHIIEARDLDKVKKHCNETGNSLIQSLYELAVLRGGSLSSSVSEYYKIPHISENDWSENAAAQDGISIDFLRENKICPASENVEGVILAIADPEDEYSVNAVRMALNKKIILKIAPIEDIEAAIEKSRKNNKQEEVWEESIKSQDDNDDVQLLKDIALGTPVVRFVNQLLLDAIRQRATDIHIEPFDNFLAVRMRIDGILHAVESPPAQMARAIISRIKILSELNIAERRMPQDGRARIKIENQKLDLRIATIPTVYGEAVAIRILENTRRSLDFPRLGFANRDREIIERQLQSPYGMFIVTGPTGSGKTTTLATALTSLNQTDRKILTIEDPIEYELRGVNQTAVKPSIGLTFAKALRSFLRHDPDVIMVGEMRDGETATIGVNAALTGHLVLTTLHTNSAAGTIPRLLDMGIDAYLLASSLRCLVGQRLVRKLCDNCKQPYEGILDISPYSETIEDERKSLTLWQPVGCDRCFNTGYSDRIVLSEVIEVDEEIQGLIKPGTATSDIEQYAKRQGMTTMLDDGIRKCMEGITTPEEVQRVVINI